MPSPTRIAPTATAHTWGEVWRVLAALLLGLATWSARDPLLETKIPSFGAWWLWCDLAIGVVAVALLLVRRRWPFRVALLITAMTAVSHMAVPACAFAVVSLATTRRWKAILAIAPVWFASTWVSHLVYPRPSEPYWSGAIISLLGFAFCVVVGFYIGVRRALVASLHERALTAEREQAMRVAQAKVAERARIAREMHDVLAHRISLIAMHSGALAYRTDLTPQQVRETAEIVRSSANLALTELRAVLGVLRDVDGHDGAPSKADDDPGIEPPQPTLGDLDSLISESGVDVQLTVDGDLAATPETLSRNAFRIVQECLTNARKHAPGQAVDLRVEVMDGHDGTGEVTVVARNPVAASVQLPIAGAGLGLLGATERAVLSGGELTFGRDRRSDFVVTARLRWSR